MRGEALQIGGRRQHHRPERRQRRLQCSLAERRYRALTQRLPIGIVGIGGDAQHDVGEVARVCPDLVVANKEENRELDVQRLRDRGIAVWVTDIEDVPQALAAMRRLFVEALGWDAPSWLDDADAAWAPPSPAPR